MGTLSDRIEVHLKRLLGTAGDGCIEIRRCELADHFACVPSQINYVLETRFTSARGYFVESRRGGGGYIRITRAYYSSPLQHHERVLGQIGHNLSDVGLDTVLGRLVEHALLSPKRAAQIRVAITQEAGRVPPEVRGIVRAALLRALLRWVLEEEGEPA